MPWSERVRRWLAAEPKPIDGVLIAALALALRLAVVIWAAGRFPPTEDGRFYDIVAQRIAAGEGYTWLWPDGVVTYAAHYPVGYPALVGGLYAIFGHAPPAAMLFNALLGAASVFAVHRIGSELGSRVGAALGALLVALHPALVFYTPALMTEGVACALVTLAAWLVVLGRRSPPSRKLRHALGLGVTLGLTTLLRPQLLLLAPVFGALLAVSSKRTAAWLGLLSFGVALGVCLPWTIRNCARMERCVLVSANGGWNLLIGAADGATGSWIPIEGTRLPAECRTVFGEADKDACFGRAAFGRIAAEPGAWLGLIPKKLSATFDYVGAAAWYLHASNPSALNQAQKLELGVAETGFQRVVVLLALLALARAPGPRPRLRWAAALLSAPWLLMKAAWVAHVGLLALAILLGRKLLENLPAALAAWVLGTTALTHIVFFGAGRYSLVAFGLLGLLAGTWLAPKTAAITEALTARAEPGDTARSRKAHAAD